MGISVAIAGATGAVGSELLLLLEERSFPVGSLRLLASERSAGREMVFAGERIPVEPLGGDSFRGVDLVFFTAGSERSREFAPAAVRSGAVVVDNSSAFRMREDVPLVVPEINPEALERHRGLVANPNCTTIVVLMAVAPLHREAGAVSLRVASYQAASGAGARAMADLEEQARAVLEGGRAEPGAFPHPLAFNLIPRIGELLDGGETGEERKLREECRKILALPGLRISALCVRVPVPRAHCAACWLETGRRLDPARAREGLAGAPGVVVVDDPAENAYPMPRTAAGTDPVQVGRIRADESSGFGLVFFVAGDQLRKGAALNAIQIAEILFGKGRN